MHSFTAPKQNPLSILLNIFKSAQSEHLQVVYSCLFITNPINHLFFRSNTKIMDDIQIIGGGEMPFRNYLHI